MLEGAGDKVGEEEGRHVEDDQDDKPHAHPVFGVVWQVAVAPLDQTGDQLLGCCILPYLCEPLQLLPEGLLERGAREDAVPHFSGPRGYGVGHLFDPGHGLINSSSPLCEGGGEVGHFSKRVGKSSSSTSTLRW